MSLRKFVCVVLSEGRAILIKLSKMSDRKTSHKTSSFNLSDLFIAYKCVILSFTANSARFPRVKIVQ